jgi:hypothetical protein
MVFFVLLIALAALTLTLTRGIYWGKNHLLINCDDIEKSLQPINLDLLQNLLDPEQENYIRMRLSSSQFFRYKLKQFRTANEYLSRASHNAAIFVALGRQASSSSDPATSVRGKALFETAVRLRVLALLARINLTMKLVFPQFSIGDFIETYDRTRARVSHFPDLSFTEERRSGS